MKSFKRLLLSMVVGGMLLTPVASPGVVLAAEIDAGVCEGANLSLSNTPTTTNNCTRNSAAGLEANSRVDNILKTTVNILTLLVGLAAVIMIIVGGFKYITSGGDASKTASAKDTILFAVIGLAVVMLAQVVVRFVIARTG